MNFKDTHLARILSRRTHTSDFVVPVCVLLLFLLGVAFIYSAQSYTSDDIPLMRQFWVKQIFYFVALGVPVYAVLAYVDYKWLYQNAHWVYLASIALLVPLVLKEVLNLPIPFVQSRYNATRWIDFGFFSIQPSEFAKIGTCVMAAAVLARNKVGNFDSRKDSMLFWIKLALIFAIPILLICLQPDLG